MAAIETTMSTGEVSAVNEGEHPVTNEIRQESILRFWRSIEYFSAQDVGKSDAEARETKDAGQSARRYDLLPSGPAPWEASHALHRVSPKPGHTWRYVLYGGVFSLDRLYRTLADVFGEDGRDVDERTPRGDSALFAVALTPRGRPVLESMTVSQAAWAVGRTLDPGPARAEWLQGFDKDAERIGSRMSARVQAWDDEQAAAREKQGLDVPPNGLPASAELIHELVAVAAESLGVTAALEPRPVLVRAVPVDARFSDQQPDTDFLNSFIADDLERVADAAAAGSIGPALASYLTEQPDVSRRVDVVPEENLDALVEALAPANVPAGRWPSQVDQSLVTSQQLAVNEIHARLGDRAGLFGVNGPPGTGKTTMLRELVAAAVVDRAHRLAALASPRDGFVPGDWTGWDVGPKEIRFPRLRPELTGFEIVVASSNNGAVENISRELPDRRAIDKPWRDAADYLGDHASRLLRASFHGASEPAPQAWGLLAATLGNKRNRSAFAHGLWFTPKDTKGSDRVDAGPGLKDWLAERHRTTGAAAWTDAVTAFTKAAGAEAAIRAERQRAHESLRALPGLTADVERAARATAQADEALVRARAAIGPVQTAYDQAATDADAARQRRSLHREARPPWWESLFTLGAASRRWHTEDEPLAARQRDAEVLEDRARAGLRAGQDAEAGAVAALDAASADERRARGLLTDASAVVDTVRSSLLGRNEPSAHVPDDAWRAALGRRERHAPWLDARWNEARTYLFLAALDLHQAFLIGAGSHARALLGAAMDVVRGAPSSAPPDAVLDAWRGLFLATPVVSTTFASVARMLPEVGAESFGWLLIDEAGQATPQAAAGSIWRARRVVAVGDPLQLEPVLTALHTTQARLRDHYRVTDTWLPDRQSVQTLTDRVTPLGTDLRRDGAPLWVGAPLRVHRRCDDPMFSVVNDAVYDGMMLHGDPGREDELGSLSPGGEERTPPILDRPVRGSTWIDVRGESSGNWIPAEGDAATWVLGGLLRRHGLQGSDVLVVSPFRAAADRLKPLVRREFGPKVTCGTVHVSQGKEAAAVVLVLGGGTDGARQWAASRPNLMNVAVSRAKHRLYVVGNREHWRELPHFDVLAARLPVHEFGGPR